MLRKPVVAIDTYLLLKKLINIFATDSHNYKLKEHQFWFDFYFHQPVYISHKLGGIAYVYWLERNGLWFAPCHCQMAYKNFQAGTDNWYTLAPPTWSSGTKTQS